MLKCPEGVSLGGATNPLEAATLLATEARREASTARALELFELALDLLHDVGPVPLTADVFRWMGTVHRELGDSVQAELLYTKSLRIAEELRSSGAQAHALNCLALMAQRRAQTEVAAGYYRQAVWLAGEVGDHRLIGMIEQNLGVMASIRGDLDSATLAIKVGYPDDEAAGILDEALVLADARHDSLRRCEVLKLRGVLQRRGGHGDWAIDTLETAQDLAIEVGDTLLTAEVTRELGDAWRAAGDLLRAIGLWRRSRIYFRELGAAVDASGLESRLSDANVPRRSSSRCGPRARQLVTILDGPRLAATPRKPFQYKGIPTPVRLGSSVASILPKLRKSTGLYEAQRMTTSPHGLARRNAGTVKVWMCSHK